VRWRREGRRGAKREKMGEVWKDEKEGTGKETLKQ